MLLQVSSISRNVGLATAFLVSFAACQERAALAPSPRAVARIGDDLRDIESVLSFVLQRGLRAEESRALRTDTERRAQADPLRAVRVFEWFKDAREAVGRTRAEWRRALLRCRIRRQLYFGARYFHAKDAKTHEEVLRAVRDVGEVIYLIVLDADPIVLVDHEARTLVTEGMLDTTYEFQDLLAEISGLPKTEASGYYSDRARYNAKTASNFAKSKNKPWFGDAAALFDRLRAAWGKATPAERAKTKAEVVAACKGNTIWYGTSELTAMAERVEHAQLVAEDQRLVDRKTKFLTRSEVDWAIDLVEAACATKLEEDTRSAIEIEMREGFSTKPEAYNKTLDTIRKRRERYLEAGAPVHRADRRRELYAAMYQSKQKGGALPAFADVLDRIAAPLARDPSGKQSLTRVQVDACRRWIRLLTTTLGIAELGEAAWRAQAQHLVALFKEEAASRPFLMSYELFYFDTLDGWVELDEKQRHAAIAHTREIYAKTGSLAKAAKPLARISLHRRQKRMKDKLAAFQNEVIKLQIQQMQMAMLIQSHKMMMNTLSEVGAEAAAAIAGDEVSNYGGGTLFINGSTHSYPYPEAYAFADFAIVKGLKPMFAKLVTDAKKSAQRSFEHLEKNAGLVLAAAIRP